MKRARSGTGATAKKSAKKKPYQRQKAIARMPERGFIGRQSHLLYKDSSATHALVSGTGTVQHVNIVARGNSINERDETVFRNKSMWLRGIINTGLTCKITAVTIALVWDQRPNGALAAYTDIFDTASPISFPKRENAPRFKILMLKRYCMGGNSAAPTTDETTQVIEKYVKFPKDLWTQLTDDDIDGDIGDVLVGSLLLCTIGDQATETLGASLNLKMRLNFEDKPKQ